MSRDHIHVAGKTQIGGTYWVMINKKGNAVEYQDYQCSHTDCSFTIPIRTGNTR